MTVKTNHIQFSALPAMSIDITSFDDLKRLAVEFFILAKKVKSVDQLDAGLKCFTIRYLNFKGDENEEHEAMLLHNIVTQFANKRTLDLLFGT